MKSKYNLMLIFLLIIQNAYGMFSEELNDQNNAHVQAYFTPQDKAALSQKLFSLLNTAQFAVYVAMYWITDDSLINKLIELKKKGLDIQIFFDESSSRSNQHLKKLLDNNIIPTIHPSRIINAGLMHNKFLIIDFKTIVTGSANFTQTVFNPNSSMSNFENITFITSSNIASEYLKEFINMEKTIFNLYINIVANNSPTILPQWLKQLSPILFKQKSRMPQIFYSRMNEFNETQRINLLNFFRDTQ